MSPKTFWFHRQCIILNGFLVKFIKIKCVVNNTSSRYFHVLFNDMKYICTTLLVLTNTVVNKCLNGTTKADRVIKWHFAERETLATFTD